MNSFVAIAIIGLVVAICGISASPFLSQDKKALLYRHRQYCQTKSELDKYHFSHPDDAIQSEDPKLKEYLLCFLQKSDYMNELGELQGEMIRKQLADLHADNSKVEVVMKECVIRKDEPLESAFGFYKCYHRHYPRQGFFFQGVYISEENQNKLRAHFAHCSKESGVPKEILDRAYEGDFADDALLKKFSHCLVKKIGFQTAEGEILETVVREKLREMVLDDSQSDVLIEKCLRERSSPEQAAFEFIRCFVQNTHLDILRNPINSEEEEKLVKIHTECRKVSALEDALIEKFKRGDFEDHPVGNKHLHCVYKTTGHIDEFGEFNQDKVRKKLSEHYQDSSLVEQYMKKCLVKKDSPEDTAYYMHSCFYENTPHKFNIFSVL